MRGDFCSQNTETITGVNYTDSYLTKKGASCLPNGGTGFPGSVSQDDVHKYVIGTLLPNSGALVPTTKLSPADVNTYVKKSAALIASIQTEYCFYYKRYVFALTEVLLLAAKHGTYFKTGSHYDTLKQNAIRLNGLLNQILLILKAILKYRYDSLRAYNRHTPSVDSEVDSAQATLVEHMRKLKDEDMEKHAKSAMIDYTLEKNSSSRNLLAIYGFMNIIAIGMLVYLYRTAK